MGAKVADVVFVAAGVGQGLLEGGERIVASDVISMLLVLYMSVGLCLEEF